MNQELANKLFDEHAFLLFLDAPPNLEFGIDYNAWTIGPLFKGVKLIPAGLHFVYFSTTSKEGTQGIRTGFFHFFEPKEILVREWNPQIEDLRDDNEIDPEQVKRLQHHIREFDKNMGPYPLDPPSYYERWKKLTSYITPGLVRRVLPNKGKVSHLPAEEPSATEIEKEEGMDFTPFDIRKSFPVGATGDDVTRWSLDKSWLTRDLLKRVYRNDYKILLGELQLSFVCLLMAQNFSGFNQWKQLVHLLCGCHELIEERPEMFIEFMKVLQVQLNECPDDFYRDILSENNFTSVMLKTLQRNIPGSNERLVKEYNMLKNFIMKKFNYDLPVMDDDEEEDEEDGPVIVDLDDYY